VYYKVCIRAIIAELGNFHKLSTAKLNEILYEIYLALDVLFWCLSIVKK